jgi:hypothetical protein
MESKLQQKKATDKQRDLISKMTSISQLDQEKYLKATLEGGCVQTSFDEDKCTFEFKYISRIEIIKPCGSFPH